MLYHSKKPTVHYLLPEDYSFPAGDFEIYSTKSKKVLVDKNDVLSYKIGNAEAMKLLTSELNFQIGDFIKGVKNVASKISESKRTSNEPKNKASNKTSETKEDETLSSKITGGFEFLTLTTKVMQVFWKIAKTDNEEELQSLKKEMNALKKTFQEKGYEPNDDFENVPFKLREKYKTEDKLNGFREGAKEFETILRNLKKDRKKD